MLAHPPAVPGQETDGGQDDGGGDQIGAEIEQRPRQHGDGDAHQHAGQEAEPGADRHVAELVAASDAIERSVDEAEQQRGLEAFARSDEEGGAHVRSLIY